jgi:RNA polymerase sigma factor (TIGR02999 family)
MSHISRVLSAIEQGDPKAAEQLLPLVYEELRRLAAQKLAREPSGLTLQPTALVHEAYLRLVGAGDPGWQGRGHFFAAAAEAMRRILVDAARRKRAARRGGSRRVAAEGLDVVAAGPAADPLDLLALDDALARLAVADPPKAELVRLRYFAGLTTEQAAEVLRISRATAERWWAFARAWLLRALEDGPADDRE